MQNRNSKADLLPSASLEQNGLLAEGRVFVYLRVSTDKQDTDNQKSGIINFCAKKNLIVSSFIEDIISGTKSVEKRKLGGIIRRMKRGDILVVSEISRLSRNLMDLMELLKQCLEKGIKILTVKEGYELGDNINSKVLAFAFGLAAEIERTLISQRIKESLARKKAEGMILGRPKGSKKKNPILNKHSDSIMRLLNNGASQATIARTFKVHRHTVKKFVLDNRRW